jgi:hypothetical protein
VHQVPHQCLHHSRTGQSETAAHLNSQHDAVRETSAHHGQTLSECHEAPGATETSPWLPINESSACKCSPGDPPSARPTFYQVTYPQNDLATPTSSVSLRVPQPALAAWKPLSLQHLIQPDDSSVTSRAPPN